MAPRPHAIPMFGFSGNLSGAVNGQYLQDGPVEEEGQQLDEVVENVALLLLHPNDVGWVVRLVFVQFHTLVPGKEPKLEEILDHNCHLHTDDRNV